MKKLIQPTLTLLAATLLASSAFASNAILQNLAKNIVMRTYQDMATTSATLRDQAIALQQSPTQDNMVRAQQAWKDVRIPWEASEAFLFGPVESLGIDGLIDTWPLNRTDLDTVLNSGRQLTPDFVRGIGANLQGFHCIEYLLFGDGVTTNQKNISQMTARQIQYLVATTTVLAERTALLASSWTTHFDPDNQKSPSYSDIIANPNPRNSFYRTESAVYTEYVRGMIGIIEEVASGKLAEPLGADIGSANVLADESPFSWNSLADFTNNIRSALNIYTGEYMGTKAGPGIKDIIAAKNPQLAAQVEQRIRQGMQKVMEIAGPNGIPFRQAIVVQDGRVRVQAAIDDLKQLNSLITSQVLPLVEQ